MGKEQHEQTSNVAYPSMQGTDLAFKSSYFSIPMPTPELLAKWKKHHVYDSKIKGQGCIWLCGRQKGKPKVLARCCWKNKSPRPIDFLCKPHENQRAMVNDGIDSLTILGPLILTSDLLLLLWGKVVGDVERLSDLFWWFAFDHVGDSLATNIKKWLDIEIIGGLFSDYD